MKTKKKKFVYFKVVLVFILNGRQQIEIIFFF